MRWYRPHVHKTDRRSSTSPWFIGWVVLWLIATASWIALLGLEWYTSGPLACPLTPDSSLYGTADWSWFPPGHVCSWEVTAAGDTFTITEEPPVARLGVLILLSLWGASLVTLGRLRGQGTK